MDALRAQPNATTPAYATTPARCRRREVREALSAAWRGCPGSRAVRALHCASRSSIDSSHSICVLNTRPKLRDAAVATSSSVRVFCSSRSIEVTGLSGDAAGHDEREEVEIGGDVQRKPVRRHRTRDVHADGGDFRFRLFRHRVGPDAGQSLDALRADAEVATGADEHFFQAAHVLHRADLGSKLRRSKMG